MTNFDRGERTEDKTEQHCMSQGQARTVTSLLVNGWKMLCDVRNLDGERWVFVGEKGWNSLQSRQGMQVRGGIGFLI